MSLVAHGVAKAFPGLEVLRDCDLTVPSGETVAILGASGTGKSTLLHCIGLLDRPDRGSIALDGRELTTLGDRSRSDARARHIGFVFQSFNLLPEFTVLENVLIAATAAQVPAAAGRQRALDLLDRVGLRQRAQGDVRVLSGGERQRVALCRALVTRPQLLLADEPTGNLDPATATVVLELMLGLAREHQASVVIVTHDPGVAGRADRAYDLVGGKLVAR